jgi:hypothetical protein
MRISWCQWATLSELRTSGQVNREPIPGPPSLLQSHHPAANRGGDWVGSWGDLAVYLAAQGWEIGGYMALSVSLLP